MTRKSKQPTKNFGTQSTENINIDVDKLPEFSRANKYIGEYNVYIRNNEVPDGTRCIIYAYSSKTGNGELRNNISIVRDGIAKFDDLRFVGKSGRGTRFDVFFKFETNPEITVSYRYAIKVTVDGPRPPRSPKNDTSISSCSSIGSPINKRKFNSSDDNENTTNTMKISKLINYSDCSDSRRESYSLSKSPESSISSSSFNLSVNSSYPCSPILQSSEYYLQMLAETASNLENLNYKDDQITTNEINGLNSVEIKNYFWFLVHRYIMMFHQNLTDQNQESLCT